MFLQTISTVFVLAFMATVHLSTRRPSGMETRVSQPPIATVVRENGLGGCHRYDRSSIVWRTAELLVLKIVPDQTTAICRTFLNLTLNDQTITVNDNFQFSNVRYFVYDESANEQYRESGSTNEPPSLSFLITGAPVNMRYTNRVAWKYYFKPDDFDDLLQRDHGYVGPFIVYVLNGGSEIDENITYIFAISDRPMFYVWRNATVDRPDKIVWRILYSGYECLRYVNCAKFLGKSPGMT